MLLQMEAEGNLPKNPEPITFEHAVEQFIKDKRDAGGVEDGVRRYSDLLKKLKSFAASRGFRFLEQLDADALSAFRNTWQGRCDRKTGSYAPKTQGSKAKDQERLKAFFRFALGFDLGFNWFNRKFDIEKKPLQSIGLVAGAIAAVLYWAAVIVIRLV